MIVTESDERMTRRQTLRRLLAVWLALVAAFLLWEVAVFRGIFARGAAWQFGRLGEFWPTLTYGALTLLLALPLIAAGTIWYRRNQRKEQALAEPVRMSLAIRRGRRMLARLHWAGLVLAVAALGCLAYGLTLPHGRTLPATVTASIEDADPGEGATILTNGVRGRGVSFHTQRLFFSSRTIRFAVVPLRDAAGGLVPRYFVELGPDETNWPDADRPWPVRREGVLVRNGLPGPLEQMYRQRGYALTKPYYVLYRDAPPVRHPFMLAALQIGLIALATLLVGWRQHRHVRTLEKAEAERAAA